MTAALLAVVLVVVLVAGALAWFFFYSGTPAGAKPEREATAKDLLEGTGDGW